MTTKQHETKNKKLEVRMSESDLALIDHAADSVGLSRSTFVATNVRIAAQNVLADSVVRRLTAAQFAELERILDQPGEELEGLKALAAKPSPFSDRPSQD